MALANRWLNFYPGASMLPVNTSEGSRHRLLELGPRCLPSDESLNQLHMKFLPSH
jgi:hypothetical protein